MSGLVGLGWVVGLVELCGCVIGWVVGWVIEWVVG